MFKEKLLMLLYYPFIWLDGILGADSSTQDAACKWNK